MNLFKTFLFCKWKFGLPNKNKFVLVDGIYNPFLKYLKKKDFTYLYRRGEEIYLLILLKCIVKLRLNALDYFAEFIKHVSPKLILTAFDYHTIFYELSKKTGIKTIMIQKGKRSSMDGIIKNEKKYFPPNSKNKYLIDYVLVYNKSVKDFYSKRIKGNFYEIGSFENNFSKINTSSQKKEVLFISNFNIYDNGHLSPKTENENFVAHELYNLAKKNKLNFNILARNRKNKTKLYKEHSYYKNILGNNFKFLRPLKKSGYDVLNQYKYIFSTYSTMAIEALVKGSRCGFIFCKSKTNPIYRLWFANFEKFKLNGPFWTTSDKINTMHIEKIFNFVIKSSEKEWKKITLNYSNRLMRYDYGNKTFKSILKKELL